MSSRLVYLDNAATTALDPLVVKAMHEVLDSKYGNPSSTHKIGREARALIEQSRKTVAALINASPSEVFFTSGGTEANNTAILGAIKDLGVKHLISSKIEHHAVSHTIEYFAQWLNIPLTWVNLDSKGHVDLNHLEELLKANPNSFVSLMHANNEIGNLLNIEKVNELCLTYGAVFHSDTVQTIAHYNIDVQQLKGLNFLSCSGHKFHGPKGIGFMYMNPEKKIKPFMHGGAQERNMRGGTENISGIIGLAKALEMAYAEIDSVRAHIEGLKAHFITGLKEQIPGVSFNGDSENGLYTVLNVCLPESAMGEMFLYRLDMAGIAASGGSACSSGSMVGSHVLNAIGANMERPNIRFSFSKFNTKEDISFALQTLSEFYAVTA